MVTNHFLLHVNNSEDQRLTKEMKRHAANVSLADENFDLETAVFLNLARSFFFKVRNELSCQV